LLSEKDLCFNSLLGRFPPKTIYIYIRGGPRGLQESPAIHHGCSSVDSGSSCLEFVWSLALGDKFHTNPKRKGVLMFTASFDLLIRLSHRSPIWKACPPFSTWSGSDDPPPWMLYNITSRDVVFKSHRCNEQRTIATSTAEFERMSRVTKPVLGDADHERLRRQCLEQVFAQTEIIRFGQISQRCFTAPLHPLCSVAMIHEHVPNSKTT